MKLPDLIVELSCPIGAAEVALLLATCVVQPGLVWERTPVIGPRALMVRKPTVLAIQVKSKSCPRSVDEREIWKTARMPMITKVESLSSVDKG